MTGRALLRRYFQHHDGLSQAALARKVGVSSAAMSLWLSGYCIPGPLNALALQRESGGEIPADSWSKRYGSLSLTNGAGAKGPTGVLNTGGGAVSPRSPARRRAAGGDGE